MGLKNSIHPMVLNTLTNAHHRVYVGEFSWLENTLSVFAPHRLNLHLLLCVMWPNAHDCCQRHHSYAEISTYLIRWTIFQNSLIYRH